MKILLYKSHENLIAKSGVGVALNHQIQALNLANVDYTFDPDDDYDIAQINTIFYDSYKMSKRAKKLGKKVIYYGHSTKEDFKNSFKGSNLIAPLFKFWITRAYNTADLIITPTNYSKNLLSSYRAIKKPIVYLSNGIDTSFYAYDPKKAKEFREKYKIDPGKKIIISVGHFMERKGIINFVDLAKKLPDYEFFWFGYTEKSLLSAEVKSALEEELKNLHFPGFVSKENLRDAYLGADLFLFLSYEETEGIVVLEALASKIPSLVRDIDVYKPWLVDGKNIHMASSIDEFMKKIKSILNKDIEDLTKEGYKVAKERDLKNIGLKLREIYKNLLNN